MNTHVVLFAGSITPYAYETLSNGKNSLETVISMFRSMQCFSGITVLADLSMPELPGLSYIRKKDWTLQSLATGIKEAASGAETIVFSFADAALISEKTTQSMLKQHRKYGSDFTFADGYPEGFCPEIVETSILDALISLAQKAGPDIPMDPLFSILQKDINAFDIETDISPVDFRHFRLRLRPDSFANLTILKSLEKPSRLEVLDFFSHIDLNRQLLRTVPSYYQIQVNEGCPQKCSVCPYPRMAPTAIDSGSMGMSVKNFKTIVEKIASFSHEAVICPSLWGECALHPEISEIIETIVSIPGLSCVIETSGVGWDKSSLERLLRLPQETITWIISLDAWEKETYDKLRGRGYESAMQCVDHLITRSPANTFVQAVRVPENEEELEAFYRGWKKRTENVIIQKYDSFAGFLPDRLVTDLSPIKRHPCWHLMREMSILADGRVPLCRDDVKNSHILGNALNEPLEAIWERGETIYREHAASRYPDPCGRCDEYYTYNF